MLSKKIFAVVMSLMMAGSNISVSAQPLDRMIVDGTQIVLNETDETTNEGMGEEPQNENIVVNEQADKGSEVEAQASDLPVAQEATEEPEQPSQLEANTELENGESYEDTDSSLIDQMSDMGAEDIAHFVQAKYDEDEEWILDLGEEECIYLLETLYQNDVFDLLEEETAEIISDDLEQVSAKYGLDEKIQEIMSAEIQPVVENEGNSVADGGTFSIQGSVEYKGDNDWDEVVRPDRYTGLPTLTPVYEDETKGEPQTLQISSTTDSFFYSIRHDGNGGGNYTIENVPTVIDGKKVNRYELAGAEVKHYEPTTVECQATSGGKVLNANITYSLMTQEIKVLKQIPGVSGDTTSFGVNYTVSNENGSSATKSCSVRQGETTTLFVPSGLSYSFSEENTDGYRYLKTELNTTENGTAGGSTGSLVALTDPFMTEQKKNYEVIFTNVSMNVKPEITINWIDNHQTDKRNSLQLKLFVQVNGAELDGEPVFTELTNENCESLIGLATLPELNKDVSTGKYWYEGLPAASDDGKKIYTYKIEESCNDYICTKNEDGTYTNRLETTFSATIQWNDSSNKPGVRPTTDQMKDILKLYRFVNDKFEEVTGGVTITAKDDKTWTVTNTDPIPAYNDSNEQYEYVLIEGEIKEDGTATQTSVPLKDSASDNYAHYTTKYYNGHGAFGNETNYCHNGQTIYQTIEETVQFKATKEWKDSGGEERPDATVTLYRYPMNSDNSTPASIEDASRVVVKTEKGDVLLSYQLSTSNDDDTETIDFVDKLQDKLPNGFALPKYDGNGNEYLYFVRETFADGDAAGYQVSYPSGVGTENQEFGALNDGKIINTRTAIGVVHVDKTWTSPSEINDYQNSEIQVALIAKDKDKNDKYSEVTAVSYKGAEGSQTISGFDGGRNYSDTEFFVQLYDAAGQPYEFVGIKETFITNAEDLNTSYVDGVQSSFTLNGHSYVGTSIWKGESTSNQYDGLKQLNYELKNSIADQAAYSIEKHWGEGVTKTYLTFTITGTSIAPTPVTKEYTYNMPLSETIKNTTPEATQTDLVTGTEEGKLQLPKYDENGYLFEYKAVEIQPEDHTWNDTIYDYRNDKTIVTNRITTDQTYWIHVQKKWIDDGDAANREPVTFTVTEGDKEIGTGTLSSTNLWETDIQVPNDPSKNDYIVTEEKVGDAEVTYAPDGAGTVTVNQIQYEVSSSKNADGKNFTLTNKKTGTVNIQIVKNWIDGQNRQNTRPTSLNFILKQDGALFSGTVGNSLVINDGNVVVTAPASETETQNVIQRLLSGITKQLDESETPQVTNRDQWTYTIEGLPLYDENGKQYRYELAEASNFLADTAIDYTSTFNGCSYSTSEGTGTYTYTYTNKLEGETDFTVYKVWKDLATGGANRPDLYMTLYRTTTLPTEDSPYPTGQVFTGYEDQLWTPAGTDDNYNWKIEIKNLEKYDENGNLYTYYMTERMNNDGKVGDVEYQTHYFGKTDDTTFEHGATDARAYNGEYIINQLYDEMKITGTKTWVNTTGYSTDELPNPTIDLYRYLSSDVNGKNTKTDVWTIVDSLTLDGKKTGYEFPTGGDNCSGFVTDSNGNCMFPKYADSGERYIYEVEETIPSKTEGVSVFTNVNKNNSLTNTYDITNNTRKIVVKKSWVRDGLSENQQNAYPNVTYRLYRYKKPADGKIPTSSNAKKTELIGTATIYANIFSENSGVGSCTFDDLRIYAPDGTLYYYYIEEDAVNGYSTTYSDGDGTSTNGIDITDEPAMDGNASREVGSTNTYDPKVVISVSGEKVWDDYGNAYGFRPEFITVTLKRKTSTVAHPGDGSSLGNQVNEETVDLSEKITWTKNDDRWEYEITGLDKYAPNGQPYIYYLTESAVEHYNLNSDGVAQDQTTREASAGNGNVTLSTLTNTLSGTYPVRKDWIDGENLYGFRPASITLQLQWKKGDSWENVDNAQFKRQDGSVVTGGTVNLTKADSMPRTNECSWIGTFVNLPVADANNNPYEYRCVETKIGNLDIKGTDGNQIYEGTGDAGPYTRTYTEQDSSSTTIENKMKTTKLVVTKDWGGDTGNLYQSRPKKITVTLQSATKPINSEDHWKPGEGDWKNAQKIVPVGEDPTVQVDITGEENWTHTFENLPVCNDDSFTLYYRVIEEKNSENSKVIAQLKSYTDETDYNSTAWSYNAERNENTLTLTNQLIPKQSIKVTKSWVNADGNAPQDGAMFELKRKKATDQEYASYNPKVTQTIKTQNGDFTWDKLPKCDANGDEWFYEVQEINLPDYYAVVKRTSSTTTDGFPTENDTFYNVELQDLTLTKNWSDFGDAYELRPNSLTLALKYRDANSISDDDWKVVPTSANTATGTAIPEEFAKFTAPEPVKNGNIWTYTFAKLPKYRIDAYGNKVKLEYKVVETEPDNYVCTYDQNGGVFTDGEAASITNTLVYGYVNLKKVSAEAGSATSTVLSGTVFEIYKVTDQAETLYTTVTTDANGNIPVNTEDYSYGNPGKHLVPGTYKLKETQPAVSHSVAVQEVSFTVSKVREETNPTGTGNLGLAWISTSTTQVDQTKTTSVNYLESAPTGDAVTSFINNTIRGAATFSKTENEKALSATDGYFGVYTEAGCTNLVASMKYNQTAKKYVLSDEDANGTKISKNNTNGVPYLWTPNTDSDNKYFYLLSGTYYVKEEIAPSGYVLDTTVRKLTISGEEGYANTGTIYGMGLDHQWENTSNQLVINKMDQYGRTVTLGDGKYLTLEATGGKTFANTRLSKIQLYQNATTPVKDDSGSAIATLDVTYSDNSWTIRHLFIPGVTYTLSEGSEQTPDNYFTASSVSFKLNADGTLDVQSGAEAVVSDAVKQSVGSTDSNANAYKNLCHAKDLTVTGDRNEITLRDVARYGQMSVTKVTTNNGNGTAVQNISFKLYKCSGTEKSDTDVALLAADEYFTTDENGVISTSMDSRTNPDTNKAFSYGLTPGTYYLLEQERGASDQYEVNPDPIYFTIENDTSASYSSSSTGAKFEKTGAGWTDADNPTINNPIDTLKLYVVKKDLADPSVKVAGAEFELTYTSANNGQPGAQSDTTYMCITNADGKLVLQDAYGKATTTFPDISNKGTYVLKETKAASGYVLSTENLVTIVVAYDSTSEKNVATISANSARATVENNAVMVTNKKTSFLVKKQDNADEPNPVIGATLAVYKWDGEKVIGDALQTLTTTEINNGVLNFVGIPEDTLCVIKETKRPYGYETAEPVYFKLTQSLSGEGLTYANTGSNLVICEEDGSKKATSVSTVKSDGTTLAQLTMTDDVVKVPVTLKKVRVTTGDDGTSTSTALEGAEFSIKKVVDGVGDATEIKAITNAHGLLVMKDDQSEIVLTEGNYVATETSAPANAYCNGASYEFNVTEKDYTDYKNATEKAKNIQNNSLEDKTKIETNVENPAYKATINVHLTERQTDAVIPGAGFTLYEKKGDNWVEVRTSTTNESGAVSFAIDHKGTYKVIETQLVAGYIVPEDDYSEEYTIADAGYNQTFTWNVENERTELVFQKNGLVNETCADGSNYKNDEEQPLSGVTFAAYAIDEGDVVAMDATATAQSSTAEGSIGQVAFYNLPLGKYQIKEIETRPGYILDGTTYYADVVSGVFAGLYIDDQNTGIMKLVNDVYRADFQMTKVDESDTDRVLPKSKYGLFRRINNGLFFEEVMVCSAITDDNGLLKFDGLLMDVEYVIRELEAPDGYEVSKNPVHFKYTLDDASDPILELIDNGDGTVSLDKNGEITWLEPRTKVSIDKCDEAGNRLAGATLRITTESGERIDGVDDWVSSSGESHVIEGVLVRGQTYILTEVSAPNGYYLAEPIKFTLSEEGVSPKADYVQSFKMIDKKIPPKKAPNGGFEIPNTSDVSNCMKWMSALLISIAGAVLSGMMLRR